MAPYLSAFLFLMFSTAMSRFCRVSAANLTNEEIVNLIDEYAIHLMDCHYSPALTLAVVKDGQVLLTKGYGYTSTNQSVKVTSKTRFAIASLTKAFTATLVAKWVHEQDNITFDTPIQSFYPEFRVTDDVRSSLGTLRDLLAHRMAIPSNFKALLMGFPTDITRDKFVKLLAFMPTELSFRDKFSYNNYMYTMAAYVIEKMSGGRKWEELIRDTFLVPLRMADTGFLQEVEDFSEFALACALINDSVLVDLPMELYSTVAPCGPAGSIYSNSEDMAKWMTFLLSDGLGPEGVALVDPEVIRLTREPSILSGLSFDELVRPESQVSHVIQSYDIGWVSANYRGYRKLYHTGGFITYSSRLWLYPDVNAGIYLNVNGPQDNKKSLLESLLFYASDLLLNEKPWVREENVCQGLQQQNAQAESSVDAPACSLEDDCKTDGAADNFQDVTDLADFVGNYSNKCFGNIEISMDASNASLVFMFGRYGSMSLRRVARLEFIGRFFGVLGYINPPEEHHGQTLKFSRSSKGPTDALYFSLDAGEQFLTRFDRVGFHGSGDSNCGPVTQISAVFVLVLNFVCIYLWGKQR